MEIKGTTSEINAAVKALQRPSSHLIQASTSTSSRIMAPVSIAPIAPPLSVVETAQQQDDMADLANVDVAEVVAIHQTPAFVTLADTVAEQMAAIDLSEPANDTDEFDADGRIDPTLVHFRNLVTSLTPQGPEIQEQRCFF